MTNHYLTCESCRVALSKSAAFITGSRVTCGDCAGDVVTLDRV